MIRAPVLCLLLAACAAQPQPKSALSPEQEQALIEHCQDGCVIVPAPVFEEMVRRLRERGA